ncbi:MAG: hypothetical protein MJ232_03105 [archaeon]|nr:hypothetical protein [archaeon]
MDTSLFLSFIDKVADLCLVEPFSAIFGCCVGCFVVALLYRICNISK